MQTTSPLCRELGGRMASTLTALAYRLSNRAGVGPNGSAHWFELPVSALGDSGTSFTRIANRLDDATSVGEIEGVLTSARAALAGLLSHARPYHVPHGRKPHRRLWLFEAAPTTPVDVNPNEVRWALDDTNRALDAIARSQGRKRLAA